LAASFLTNKVARKDLGQALTEEALNFGINFGLIPPSPGAVWSVQFGFNESASM
jgi:hypothetical protein